MAPEQDGIFGKLPESRPGIRSPRRRSTKDRQAAQSRAASPPPRAAPPPRPAPPRPSAPEPPGAAAEPPESARSGGAGLEDLAWAGVAAAAEAATIGVRLASRAMEALRGPTERP